MRRLLSCGDVCGVGLKKARRTREGSRGAPTLPLRFSSQRTDGLDRRPIGGSPAFGGRKPRFRIYRYPLSLAKANASVRFRAPSLTMADDK